MSWGRSQAEPPCPGWLLGLDGIGFSLSDSELVTVPEPKWGPDTLSAPALQPPGPRPQRRAGQPVAHSAESPRAGGSVRVLQRKRASKRGIEWCGVLQKRHIHTLMRERRICVKELACTIVRQV